MAAFVHLSLTHFRGFRDLGLDFEPSPIVLTGANGAGKTNILEAISLFAPGGGLRQARLGEIDLRLPGNAAGMAWAAHARVASLGNEFSLGTGRDPLGPVQVGRERRVNRVNGAPVKSQASFAEFLSVQWLVPSMDRLFDDGPSQRRRFLDRLVGNIDPAHGARIAAYEAAFRERARVLRGEVAVVPADRETWLDGLESEMAGSGVAIAASRLEVVRLLNQALAEAEDAFPRAELSILGAVEGWLKDASALLAEERLRERLKEARAEDGASGLTQWGTHRSDLGVHFAGRSLGGKPLSAQDCSTGEQRALLLSIALAEARLARRLRGQAPVLLLDEALAHLDARRRDCLYEAILALEIQAWLTGAEPEPFKALSGRAQFFHLEHGQAREAPGMTTP